MKLKTVTIDGKTYAEVVDDKPVYVIDDKDVPFDAVAARDKITQLNGEAKGHREAKEKAETDLKGFKDAGITDPEAAKKALETVANLDAGKLMEAGKVEEIKAAAQRAAEEKVAAAQRAADEQIAAVSKERDGFKTALENELVGGAFARSKFIGDKIAMPADFMQAKFGPAFKVEEGKAVAYDAQGNKVFSRAKPGEVAEFDEALEILVDGYPQRESILKGNVGGGGGSGGTDKSGKRTMTRKEFAALDPVAAMKAAGEYTIVD